MTVKKKSIFSFYKVSSEDIMFDIATIIDRVDIIPLNNDSLLSLSDTMAELYLNDEVYLSSCVINILKSVYMKNKIFNLPFKAIDIILQVASTDECNEELKIECDIECQINKLTELLTINTIEEFHNEFLKFKQNIEDRDLHNDIINRINKLQNTFNMMVELTHEQK